MGNKFSKSWINMRVDYDNISRSTVLVDHINKLSQEDDIDLIDLYLSLIHISEPTRPY